MTHKNKFTLRVKQQTLEVTLNSNTSDYSSSFSLNYEYLRVFSPSELQKMSSNKSASSDSTPHVFNKKNVQLIAIEPLGKHGHRFIFDDGFNDIYSANELLELSQNFNDNWSRYIEHLSSTQSREESINFKAIT